MALRWIIAGGGTGGHVTPAIALGEQIVARGEEVLFVGSERGLEARLLPELGYEFIALPSHQVMGQGLGARVSAALGLVGLSFRSIREIRRFRPNAIISVGGYAAMPTAIAAVLTRTPLYLVEPNAKPGRVNRLTARFAKAAFLGFEAAGPRLPGCPRTVATGIPVRTGLIEAAAAEDESRPEDAALHVFVTGGSQGARQLNENVPEAIRMLSLKLGREIQIVHQTGEAERECVETRYREAALTAEVIAFERDMPARYRWADVVICRAGALSIAELCLVGRPGVLVPYPFAADDHQTANAEAVEAGHAGILVDAKDLDPARLFDALARITLEPGRLAAMRVAAKRLGRPNAAAQIIEACAREVGSCSAA